MGIQINGNTDTITAIDGALIVSGAELSAVTNLNATGIVTASGFVGNITGNLNSSGVSTFTNGPVLVGSGSSTGTASQRLQVTGGAYVSGNIGVGITNPQYNLEIAGSENVTTQISLWGKTIGQPQTLVEPGRIYATAAGLGPGDLLLQPTGGNLGIGTASPTKKLHVQTSFVSGEARGGGFTQTLFESNNAGTSYWEFQANSSSANDILFSKSSTGSYGIVGYDHSTDSLRFFANAAERVRIDSSGRVTTPYQPKFHAYGVGGGTFANGNYWIFPSTLVNIGNHYNASNGIFTAPIAGTYLFYWSFIGNTASDVYRYNIFKNNSSIAGGIQLRIDTTSTGSEYGDNGAMQTMLTLSANDTVRIYFSSDGGSNSYPGGNAPSDPYSTFGGQLLG